MKTTPITNTINASATKGPSGRARQAVLMGRRLNSLTRHRILLTTVLACLWVVTSHAQPPSGEFGILTNQPSAGWYSFGFDGRFVVWGDTRTGANQNNIYAFDLETGTEIPVSADPLGHNGQCRVSGGVVVWTRQPAPLTVLNNQLWVMDLTGRIWPAGEKRMITTFDCPGQVDISDDWIAWIQDGACGGTGGNLYAQNLRTGERILVPAPGTKWHVVFSGDKLFFPTAPGYLWSLDWDTYGYDLVTRTLFPVKVGPGNFGVPSADGNYLLLEEFHSAWYPPHQLWLHDLVTSNEVLIAEGSNTRGAVSGNRVVYRDDAGQVFAYDISSGDRDLLSAGPVQGWPALELRNNIAVWTDERPLASPGNWFIYGYRFANTDTTPPAITCPPDVTTGTDSGLCSASNVPFGTPTASDDVAIASITNDAPTVFPKGTTSVTWTATDTSGNTSTCVQRVTVEDREAPTISCPADFSLPCSIDLLVPVSFTVSAHDNCDAQPTVICNPPSGSLFPIGTTTVTCTATDAAGNTSACSFTVTVTGQDLSALGPAQVWIGLKNSDDVGTKFDLLAEVFKNGSLIGSGELDSVPGGSSGFNNAVSRTVNLALPADAVFAPGDTLSFRLSVRIAVNVTGHRSGTARLWFNDAAANSQFGATVAGVANQYFLLNGAMLGASAGSGPKKTIDVFVDKAVGGNPFRPFGTWSKAF